MMAQHRSRRKARDDANEGDPLGPLQERTAQVRERVKAGLRVVGEQVTQKARETAGALSEEALRLAEERKGLVADRIDLFASAAHQAAGLLRTAKLAKTGEYFDSAAAALDGVTAYLEEGDVKALLADAVEQARRHPAAVAAGVVLLGLAAGRLLATAREGQFTAKRSSKRPKRIRAGGKAADMHHAKGNGSVHPRSARRGGGSEGKPHRLAE